jgi:hypothetical protein
MRLSYGFDNECQNVSLEHLSLGTFVMKLFRCNLFLFPGKNRIQMNMWQCYVRRDL